MNRDTNTVIGLWPIVLRFAHAMQEKLDENRHKGDREAWLRDLPASLVERVRQETCELEEAGKFGSKRDVEREAADVANMAMMVWDSIAREDVPDACVAVTRDDVALLSARVLELEERICYVARERDEARVETSRVRDAQELIALYAEHVGACEGVDFLADGYRPGFPGTDEQWFALCRHAGRVPQYHARSFHDVAGRGRVAVVDFDEEAAVPRVGQVVRIGDELCSVRGVERRGRRLDGVGLIVKGVG